MSKPTRKSELVIPVDGLSWRLEVVAVGRTGKFTDTFNRMLRRGTADEKAPPAELVAQCKRALEERKAAHAEGREWHQPSWWNGGSVMAGTYDARGGRPRAPKPDPARGAVRHDGAEEEGQAA